MYRTSETIDGTSTVPAFLTKLWTLVEETTVDDLIAWDPSGKSFHVFDQARFAKEILPLYFKHSNMSSFIRQLNMYGFRKVSGIEHGGLVKHEADDMEFQHMYFVRGHSDLLGKIKRKVGGASVKSDEVKLKQEDVSRVLTDVRQISSRQEKMSTKLTSLQRENEILWREVANLRQKHSRQQQIVNKLVQFLLSMVGRNQSVPLKRQMPMIENTVPPKIPKSGNSLSIQGNPYTVQMPSSTSTKNESLTVTEIPSCSNSNSPLTANAGPVIEDVSGLGPNGQILGFESDLLGDIPTLDGPETVPLEDIIDDAAANLQPYTTGVMPSAVALNEPQEKDPNEVVTEQLESLTADVDALKDLLAGGQFTFDTNSILELFNPDSPIFIPDLTEPPNNEENTNQEEHGAHILGNELIEYRPLSLYDFPDVVGDSDLLGAHEGFTDTDLVTPDVGTSEMPTLKTKKNHLLEEVD